MAKPTLSGTKGGNINYDDVKNLWIGNAEGGIGGNVVINALVDDSVKAYENTPLEKDIPKELLKKYQGYEKVFDKNMEIVKDDILLFRGARIDSSGNDNNVDVEVPKFNKRYTSTSISNSVAKNYSGWGDDEYSSPVIYNIKVHRGAKIARLALMVKLSLEEVRNGHFKNPLNMTILILELGTR